MLLITVAPFVERFLPNAGTVLRDFLPAVLMPVVYWQSGRFATHINKGFQATLQRFDSTWLSGLMRSLTRPRLRWIVALLEFAYLSCYVLVPAALAVLHLAREQHHANEYWIVPLAATYPCYVFTAFVPTHPPRSIETHSRTTPPGKIRRFNLWIVRWFSIQWNTFPSAHVTATLGSSLALFHFVPRVGLVFVPISVAIALGAVLGRYHYAADILVAVVFTAAVYAAVLLV